MLRAPAPQRPRGRASLAALRPLEPRRERSQPSARTAPRDPLQGRLCFLQKRRPPPDAGLPEGWSFLFQFLVQDGPRRGLSAHGARPGPSCPCSSAGCARCQAQAGVWGSGSEPRHGSMPVQLSHNLKKPSD